MLNTKLIRENAKLQIDLCDKIDRLTKELANIRSSKYYEVFGTVSEFIIDTNDKYHQIAEAERTLMGVMKC